MLTIERPADPITEYFFPWSTKTQDIAGNMFNRKLEVAFEELEAASKINEVALRIKLSEVQRLLQENEKILSSKLTPIKALFINLFVNVGLFALLSGLAVGLLHYLSNEPFVTQTAWGQTFLQFALTAAIGSNLILLLVSTTKSIIRTIVTV